MDKPEGLSIQGLQNINEQFEPSVDRNSKIVQHVYEHDHSIDIAIGNIAIVNKARNYHKRLFLEA